MAATYRERNKVYKDNFVRLGNAMHALFPEGLTIYSPEDWTRLYFFMLQQVKASRYATNFKRGGHKDSIHDSAVYAAMLEAFDETINQPTFLLGPDLKQVDAHNKSKKRNASASAKVDVNLSSVEPLKQFVRTNGATLGQLVGSPRRGR